MKKGGIKPPFKAHISDVKLGISVKGIKRAAHSLVGIGGEVGAADAGRIGGNDGICYRLEISAEVVSGFKSDYLIVLGVAAGCVDHAVVESLNTSGNNDKLNVAVAKSCAESEVAYKSLVVGGAVVKDAVGKRQNLNVLDLDGLAVHIVGLAADNDIYLGADARFMCLRICRLWLRMHGFACGFRVVWDDINLQDQVEEARAMLYKEQARKLRIENDAAERI